MERSFATCKRILLYQLTNPSKLNSPNRSMLLFNQSKPVFNQNKNPSISGSILLFYFLPAKLVKSKSKIKLIRNQICVRLFFHITIVRRVTEKNSTLTIFNKILTNRKLIPVLKPRIIINLSKI